MTMTSAAYDALIADILGGLDADKAVEKPPQGLGAMTGRAGTSAPAEASTETEAPSSQAAVNKFMKAIAAQRGSRAPAFVEKSYDPLTFTSEHIQRAGLSVMDALAMAIESPDPDKIKIPVGEDLKGNYFKDAEAALSKMKSSAKDSSLDMRAASLTRGMTSKQTDTQPTVSTDTSLDRFDSQGDVRDLPALDDEDAPELDTRSNELLDKELPSAGLGSRPVAEALTDDDMGFNIPEYKEYKTADEMSELEILARTIEAEAALESYKGKIAVGATIANRASSGSYGKDIRGVILKPAQFSPWNKYTGAAKGKQGKNMMKLRASEDSYKAANDILTGNYDDPTNGATHYVNESIAEGQKWIDIMKGRKKGTVTIGNHLFGNADNNKKYDGKSYIFDRKSETTDQPVEATPITVKAIQRIIGTVADGDFGPTSRKKAIEYLKEKNMSVAKDTTDEDLMDLVVRG